MSKENDSLDLLTVNRSMLHLTGV